MVWPFLRRWPRRIMQPFGAVNPKNQVLFLSLSSQAKANQRPRTPRVPLLPRGRFFPRSVQFQSWLARGRVQQTPQVTSRQHWVGCPGGGSYLRCTGLPQTVAPEVRWFHLGGFFQSAAAGIELRLAVAPEARLTQPHRPLAKSVFLPSANYPPLARPATSPHSTVASHKRVAHQSNSLQPLILWVFLYVEKY